MTVAFDADAAAVEGRFAAQFAAATFETSVRPEVAHDNETFDPPNEKPWMRLTIIPADLRQVTMGAPTGGTHESVGLAIVDVHVPRDEGSGVAWRLADVVAGWFRGVTADGMEYVAAGGDGPTLRRVGHDGRSYQVNVIVPWRSFRTA